MYKTGVPKRRKPRPEVSPEKTGVETFNKIAAHVAPRVLLAEDAPVNQEVALLMLDSLGCDTTLAENGREALDACQSQQFDLVFMDCQMPEMDGYEATRAIRQFENNEGKNTSLPVVALTANVVDGDREACIVAGMDDYLSKPFTRDKLAAVLEKWIVDYNPLSRESAAELAVADSTIDSPVSNGATFPIDQNLIESLGGVALLDPSVLEKYVEMDPDGTKGLLQRVLSVYLNTLPDYLVNTTTAGREQDVDQLREVAHSLKSGSENVGAMRIAALSREIEARARDNSIQGVDELLELLESTCQETTKVFVERYPAA